MLRFYGADLKAVMTESLSINKPVVMVKNNGIYLMVEDGEKQTEGQPKHVVYAQGCEPERCPQWQATAQKLVGKNTVTETVSLTDGQRWELINNALQLVLMPANKPMNLFIEMLNYVPVAEYRHLTDRMNTMTWAHFNACVGVKELTNWRGMAYRLLGQCLSVHCKRANDDDHHQFITAASHLHRRTQCVSPAGALHIVH